MIDVFSQLSEKAAVSPKLRAILKRVKSGSADFNDTAQYSGIYSDMLGKVLSQSITDIDLSEREEACISLLRGSYDEMNDILGQVQASLDSRIGVSIKPQQAAFPTERVTQFAHSLIDPTVDDDVIKRRAGSGSANISRSFHDDYIGENAKFRNDAGLKCYITRTTNGETCKWCADVAGKYLFGSQPSDIFRRHDNCDCTIIYDGQVLRGKQNADGSRSKTWEEIGEVPADYQPIVFTQEQAKAVEAKNKPKILTNGERRGTISGRGSGTGSYLSVEHTYEKIGEIDFNDQKAVAESLAEFENKYRDSDIEHCRVICKNGEVYEIHGDRYSVNTELLGDKMKGSINEHNHVTGESQYSFSWEDIDSSVKDDSHISMAYDEKYRYSMTFPNTIISEDSVLESYQRAKESVDNDMIFNPERVPVGDEQHERIKRTCEELGIKYVRVPI